MKIMFFVVFAAILSVVPVSNAGTIVKGDLHIQDGGDLVFSDGSVQNKAQVQGPPGPQGPPAQVTLSAICAAIKTGGMPLPNFCGNRTPIANAGPSQNAVLNNVVTVDGSGSSDPDGDFLAYSWTFVSKPAGSNATLSSHNSPKSTFFPDVEGTYTVRLTVSDGSSDSTETVAVIASTGQYLQGRVVKTIPFPAGISGVSDIVYDSATQSLLVFAYELSSKVVKIIRVDPSSGVVLHTTPIVNPNFYMNHASEFTKAGSYYYGTSYGTGNGGSQSYVYKIDLLGNILASFPCPATSTGGFCEGLAWDGQYLWSGASDNKSLTQFSTSGSVQANITPWNTISIRDLSYDTATNQLLVVKGGRLRRIDPVTAIEVSSSSGFREGGDWDGNLFWTFNSSTQELEGVYFGN